MLFPLDTSPAAASALSALVSAGIGLRAVRDALDALRADTRAAAAAADWQSPTARRFNERADELHTHLGELHLRADDAAHEAATLRTRLIVATPSGLHP